MKLKNPTHITQSCRTIDPIPNQLSLSLSKCSKFEKLHFKKVNIRNQLNLPWRKVISGERCGPWASCLYTSLWKHISIKIHLVVSLVVQTANIKLNYNLYFLTTHLKYWSCEWADVYIISQGWCTEVQKLWVPTRGPLVHTKEKELLSSL